MKKFLLAMCICTGFCVTAAAQSKFSLGPNAGFGHTWISHTNGAKFKLAANAGLDLVYSASEHFGIGLDAKYSFEGSKSNFVGTSGGTSLDLNYFRFPLKAIYFFNNYGNAFRPKVFAGPSLGLLSSAKVGDINAKGNFKSSDFGITAGLGFNYRLVKNSWFTADVNYLHGLTDISKSELDKNHNRNLQLNVGVNFGL